MRTITPLVFRKIQRNIKNNIPTMVSNKEIIYPNGGSTSEMDILMKHLEERGEISKYKFKSSTIKIVRPDGLYAYIMSDTVEVSPNQLPCEPQS